MAFISIQLTLLIILMKHLMLQFQEIVEILIGHIIPMELIGFLILVMLAVQQVDIIISMQFLCHLKFQK